MKSYFLFFTLICLGMIMSCKNNTEADEYTSIWKPYSETKWTLSGSPAEGFKATNGGFSFTANIADTGTYVYTFIPGIYVVSNMTSASSASVSFRAKVVNGPDTLALAAGGTQIHNFGTVGGTIQTKGADSVLSAGKKFNANENTSLFFSVNPDSCSRELRFNVKVSWNPYAGGTTVLPLPKQKKVAVEFFDVVMQVNNIDVLDQK